jgi:hypothetical protein
MVRKEKIPSLAAWNVVVRCQLGCPVSGQELVWALQPTSMVNDFQPKYLHGAIG